MSAPVLVVMAAGMGSRYGGLKQIDPVDEHGNIIIHYSLFDAYRAGFRTAVFVIKPELEETFKEVIGPKVPEKMEIKYVHQISTDLPEGYTVPEGRTKPWGTAHAALAARKVVDGPFAIINADDYYGVGAFKTIYDYLVEHGEEEDQCAMVGYILKNTLTENGHVARGVCVADENHHLVQIDERTKIIKTATGAAYSEDDGQTWVETDPDGVVSMNFWGFSSKLIQDLVDGFPAFLDENVPKNPMKCEYLLPATVGQLMKAGKLTVNVLQSTDKWHGVTYKEDKPEVMKAIQELKDQGLYPQGVWEE